MEESDNEVRQSKPKKRRTDEVRQSKPKKRRTDQVKDPNVRMLKLDLSKCPDWVRTQSNEELLNVFKIGVAVKESITMQVTGGRQNFDQVLTQV